MHADRYLQPSLFISHGSPMLAVEEDAATAAWDRIGAGLQRPRAVVVASAHWLTPHPMVGAAPQPATVHDFGGFPDDLYQVQYPAQGDPELAAGLVAQLRDAGFAAAADPLRGLDHGIWVVLRHLFPQAEVPVVPLSLQPAAGPEHHYRMGLALADLRRQGVLILGSGGYVHNLREYFEGLYRNGEPEHVRAFRHWMRVKLEQGDIESLLRYRELAPHAERAHPTDEHLLPLFVALGAGAGAAVEVLYDGVSEGVLGMDAIAFHHQDSAQSTGAGNAI